MGRQTWVLNWTNPEWNRSLGFKRLENQDPDKVRRPSWNFWGSKSSQIFLRSQYSSHWYKRNQLRDLSAGQSINRLMAHGRKARYYNKSTFYDSHIFLIISDVEKFQEFLSQLELWKEIVHRWVWIWRKVRVIGERVGPSHLSRKARIYQWTWERMSSQWDYPRWLIVLITSYYWFSSNTWES